MDRAAPRPNLLIRPNGEVQLLEAGVTAVAAPASYADSLPRLDYLARGARDRRQRPRGPDSRLRGRIVDLWE